MKNKFILLSIIFVILALSLRWANTQTPDDRNKGSWITLDSGTGEVTLSWWGRSGNFYKIETSEDLLDWTVLPTVEEGFDKPIERGFPVDRDHLFYRLRICSLIAKDGNMVILPGGVTFIGKPEMRGFFENGNEHGLEIDNGVLFSTGIAGNWNKGIKQNIDHDLPGDEDLEEWMLSEGFFEYGAREIGENTHNASGVEIEFEVAFDDPLVEFGIVEVPFVFASEEYYEPGIAFNDGMAVFLFELDSKGEIIPGTRTNIGLLPQTETHSRALNVNNAGEVIQESEPLRNNLQESGFRKNSSNLRHYEDVPDPLPPFGVGYSGFTGRLVGRGGVVDDPTILALVRQPDLVRLADEGGGGLLLRATYQFHPGWLASNDKLSAYVVAFGREGGQEKFSLYRVEDRNVNSHIVPGESVESVYVSDFNSDEWYYIKVEAQGDTLRVRYWKKGTVEPEETWHIEFTDPDPLGGGFFGAIHTDTHDQSRVHWDLFEAAEHDYTDFSECDTGFATPFDWTALGYAGDGWRVVEDSAAMGGKFLEHVYSGQSLDDARISILRWDKDMRKVEAGKRYRMKVVVADAKDQHWNSAAFLECGGIRVIPVPPE